MLAPGGEGIAEPPPLRSAQGSASSLLPASLAAVGVLAAVNCARCAVDLVGFGLPCQWLRLTGIPCPGCGATRCLAACGRLDLAASWRWNPLVMAVAMSFLLWPIILLIGRALPAVRLDVALVRFSRGITGRRIIAALVLNWLYLCWTLPR